MEKKAYDGIRELFLDANEASEYTSSGPGLSFQHSSL